MSAAIDMSVPANSAMVQMMIWRSGLHIQANTGMINSRGSVSNLVRERSTTIPNALISLHNGLGAYTTGPEGVLVNKRDRTDWNGNFHPAGEVAYFPITSRRTIIAVFEDLDARIVELGGTPFRTGSLKRKGKTDAINEAAERRHVRRLTKILELLG